MHLNSTNVILQKNEFSLALGAVEHFFWHDFCDNYLELIKNQLFKPEEYSEHQVRATKATLYNVLLRILQLYAPYMPYITETIYQQMFRKFVGVDSIHHTRFETVQQKHEYKKSAHAMAHLLDVVAQVRKLKSDQKLSLKTELGDCMVVADQPILDELQPLETLLKGVTNAKIITYATDSAGISILDEYDGVWRATVCLK